jgi:hypothetical protein
MLMWVWWVGHVAHMGGMRDIDNPFILSINMAAGLVGVVDNY